MLANKNYSDLDPFLLPFPLFRFPIILSIENHCSVQQQKKIALYLKEIFSDKLDLSSVSPEDSKQLPSPQSLKGKVLVKVNGYRNLVTFG